MKTAFGRKMRLEWNTVLSIDYFERNNCWASLEDLQNVIPYHSNRYKQIVLNASNSVSCVPSHDLTFSTAFIVSVLFLMVKASRQMTYQHLTVAMVRSVGEIGIIDQLSSARLESVLPDGLKMSHFIVLNHLVRLEGNWSPVRLASAFQVTKDAITNTLKKLEKRGLVSIEADPL